MVSDPIIIDNIPTSLTFVCSIDPCDCLQEVVLYQFLIQIHHLLNRSIKSCQQHRSNHHDTQSALLIHITMNKRFFKVFDLTLVSGLASILVV